MMTFPQQTSRRGSILIVAMVVLFALAGLVLALNHGSRVDSALSSNTHASRQVDAIERGAEQYVLAILSTQRDSLDSLVEADFTQVPVGDGFFWIVRPNYDDESLPTWGLMDEASKVHLNTATAAAMVAIPGMTDALAAAIVDWRDEDDAISPNGAESGTYLSKTDGYRAKNDNFESVEELLLVEGITRELLYGPSEIGTTVVTEYYQAHGLADFFTAWSRMPNTAADGSARVNINTQRTQLRQVLTTRISEARATEILNRVGTQPALDLFDFAAKGGVTFEELKLIEDYVTSSTARGPVRGRINVNVAPREVLLTLGLSESDVDSMLARRSAEVQASPTSTAWVYDLLKEKSAGIASRISGSGRHYSADIVAVDRTGRAFKRVQIVVDTVPTTPQIVYRRDISDRGVPDVVKAFMNPAGAN